ncbi:MAG: polymer-forming cytoskeletal protein [Burkholderiales bacterium]|nr:polymer-forming cytoskeletal protein [Burkholderiales bacterium]
MWPSKKSQPTIRSLVGEGTRLKGELHFHDGMRIDGEVQGDVLAEGDGRSLLVISEKARVYGKVKACHVIINGEVVGPVEATEMLELQPKARIVGDVRYELLEMHPGALIEGELQPLKSGERPALKLAASNDS